MPFPAPMSDLDPTCSLWLLTTKPRSSAPTKRAPRDGRAPSCSLAAAQFFEQLALLLGQSFGHVNAESDEKVAARIRRRSLAGLARANATKCPAARRAVRRRTPVRPASALRWWRRNRVNDVYRLDVVEIAADTFEARIVCRANDEEKITGRRSGLIQWQAMAGHAKRHPFLHAHRNSHRQRLVAHHLARSCTLRARRINDDASAAAFRTTRNLLDVHTLFAPAVYDLAGAAAFFTRARLCSPPSRRNHGTRHKGAVERCGRFHLHR